MTPIVLVLIAAALWWYSQQQGVWSTPRYDPRTGTLTPNPLALQPRTTLGPSAIELTAQRTPAGSLNPLGAVLSGVGTATGIATGVGLGLTGGLVATGIGAVAGIVAWGVLRQGWFRGGEEALVVNPARDQFFGQFAPIDPYRDLANPPGFYGLAWLLAELGDGDRLHAALRAADRKDELTRAVSDIQAYLAANQPRAITLWNTALRTFPLSA